jgi:Tol biopolymer transport system component
MGLSPRNHARRILLALACLALCGGPVQAIHLEQLSPAPSKSAGPVWSSEPAYSPTGNRIAFTRAYYADNRQSLRTEITLLTLDDASIQVVSMPAMAQGQYPGSPTWSPDGKRIAVSVQQGIAVFDLTTQEYRVIATDHKGDLTPSWAPDGDRIAFQSQQRGIMDIWLSATDGSTPTMLFGHNAVEGFPKWSPDGKYLAISSSRDGSYDIWIIPVGLGYPRRLTQHAMKDIQPAWSPDGHFVVFVSDRAGSSDLWVIPAKGGEATRLTWGSGEEVQPDWSPDGRSIVFTSNESGSLEVWQLSDLPPRDLLDRHFSATARRAR